jgi:hypothetical protein
MVNNQRLEQQKMEGITSMAEIENMEDINEKVITSHNIIDGTKINSEDFSVYFNDSINGLQVRTKDLAEREGTQLVDLKFYYEKTDLSSVSKELTTSNLPLERLSNNSFKFNISIPDVSKTATNIQYLVINVSSKLKIKNDTNKIGLYAENYAILLDFSDIKDFNYKIENNLIKIDIKGLNEVNIDPTITFTTNNVQRIEIAQLSANTFVVGWCDATGSTINFETYYTNGTNITKPITVFTSFSGCTYEDVGISAFNSTLFVIAYYDRGNNDVLFSVYYSNGTLYTGPKTIDADSTLNVGFAISVSALNSTSFVVAWKDSPDDNVFSVYLHNGTLMNGPTIFDESSGSNSGYGAVSVSAFNSTSFVVGWHDSDDNYCKFVVYSSNGTLMTSTVNVDTSCSNNNVPSYISVSALNSTSFVVGWNDDVSSDSTFAVYNSAGTLMTGPTDADTNVGDLSSISVSTINSSAFVISWFDDTDDDDTFAVYNSAGTLMAGPIDSSTSTTSGLNSQAIASSSSIVGIGFCNQNFVHAYAVSTTVANFTSYYANGTVWDGNCPDETPPATCYSTTGKTLYVPNGCTYYIPSGTTGYT